MATVIVGLVVLVIVGLAVLKMVRDRMEHKSSCGCGCSGCANAGMCHPEQQKK